MKTLRFVLIAALVTAAQFAQAIPVNEKNLDEFRAYTMNSCKKKFVREGHEAEDQAVCDCTDDKVAVAFRAANWETGAMTSAADKTQFTALHSKAMSQCNYKMLTNGFAKEQADLCKMNINRIPDFAKLDLTGQASACECAGQKIAIEAYGTDDSKIPSFSKTFDFNAVMPRVIAACAGTKP